MFQNAFFVSYIKREILFLVIQLEFSVNVYFGDYRR